MAGAQGTATLSFPVDAQPAQYVTSTVVTDSAPNPNPQAWGAAALPSSGIWRVAFGGGTFVAVRNSTTIAATSSDGATWTQQTLPSIGSNNWQDITYGGGTFVVVTTGVASSATSPDGVTWTQQTMPVSAAWSAVTYGSGTFVAVAQGGSIAATSPDGVTWTQQTLPVSAAWSLVAYGNNTFVAVVGNNTSTAATSSDGVTWTPSTMPFAALWNGLVYANGLFVTLANSFALCATSPDGVTWTQRPLPYIDAWHDVVWGNGVFVAMGNLNAVAVSTDGINWATATMPLAAIWINGAYGNNTFVVVTNNSSNVALSPDGLTSGVTLPNTRTTTTVNTQIVPAYPVVGSNIASVTVTGQTGLLTTSTVDAWMQANDSTASHNAYEHGIAPIKLTTGELIAGTGFTITGVSDQRIDGDFIVHWIWRD